MIADEFAFASIRILGQKLRAREFSALELAEFFLNRVEIIGRKLNAVVTVTRELALEQARRADRELADGKDRGPLHGIPYGAKDLLATRGIPTSWGAAPLKEQMFDDDATVIARLQNAGAVLVAKLAMVEIAGGMGYEQANATFTGPGLNPWDPSRWAGGSSSGSGAAVGAGIVPLAIGSETWGSIMTPAGFCGVTGLRPTYGRVSRHGAMALSWTMDKLGPLARTADDCGLVLAAIAGPDPADPTSAPHTFEYTPGESKSQNDLHQEPRDADPPRRFKLATLAGAAEHVQPEVKANYERSLEVLLKFADIEEAELPDLPYNEVASVLISCEMAAAFEGMVTSGDVWELTAAEDHWGAHAGLVVPAKDYINALRIRRHIQQALDKLLAKYDAIVTPTLPTVAYPLDQPWKEYRRGHSGSDIGGAGNAAGVPAITVPNGFGEKNLPTGLQFVARAFAENRLLAVAAAYQSATDWHTKHPQ
jgi:aspartyl-tRNA(Asn)/glutamyl-tRNA(Gln) amidotransferase subunit A